MSSLLRMLGLAAFWLAPVPLEGADIISDHALYVLVEEEATQSKADEVCVSRYNSKLASIHCDEEQEEISNLIASSITSNSPNDRAFIGLYHHRNNDVVYAFDDGSDKDYTWADAGGNVRESWSGDGENGVEPACVEVIENPKYEWSFWNDLPCTATRFSICNYADAEIIANCAFDEMNECEDALHMNDCDANALCTNCDPSAGDCNEGFTCACKPGFSGDGKLCQDIDECLVDNGGCHENAQCTNTISSRTCECNPGFIGDGETCDDIDECLTNNGGCDAHAECTNTPGGFVCACNEGYTGDGMQCEDIDECLTENGGCDANAECINTVGSNDCVCHAGFNGDGVTCTVATECDVDNGGCHANADCNYVVGGHECVCQAGFSGSGLVCNDVDECFTNNGDCGENAICTNTVGSRDCTCESGFTGDGFICSDTDECAIENDCDENADCTNTIGGYTCQCQHGFVGDGETCAVAVQVSENMLYVLVQQEADRDAGSAICDQLYGTKLASIHCEAQMLEVENLIANDHSQLNPNDRAYIGLYHHRTNGVVYPFDDGTDKDYTWTDEGTSLEVWNGHGEEGDEPACVEVINNPPNDWKFWNDLPCSSTRFAICNYASVARLANCASDSVDECADAPNDCHADAVCTDCDPSSGNCDKGYTCECAPGFEGDGTSCQDIDECLSGNGDCSVNALCTNTFGSRTCTCNTGWSGNGVTCTSACQLWLYKDKDYSGTVYGPYSDGGYSFKDQDANDEVSSIKFDGPAACCKAFIYHDHDYGGGTVNFFPGSYPSVSDNLGFSNDRLTSFKVVNYCGASSPPLPGGVHGEFGQQPEAEPWYYDYLGEGDYVWNTTNLGLLLLVLLAVNLGVLLYRRRCRSKSPKVRFRRVRSEADTDFDSDLELLTQ